MAVALTLTETEVYGGAVFAAYTHTDYFGTTGMQFYGVRPTEVVNVPVTQQGDASFLDDGADHTNEDSSFIGAQVPLFDPIKSSNLVKQTQVDTRPDLAILENLGRQHGRNVGRVKTIGLLNLLAGAADGAGNNISGDFDGASDLGAEVKNGVKAVATAMDEAGVPPEGRHMMLKSSSFYELADQDGVMSVDFGGQANRQRIGGNLAPIMYLNILILNVGVGFGQDWTDTTLGGIDFPTALDHDMTQVHAVAWHEDAWALRHQTQLQTVTPFIDHKQAWLVLARLHMGAAEVMTQSDQDNREGIYALVDTTA